MLGLPTKQFAAEPPEVPPATIVSARLMTDESACSMFPPPPAAAAVLPAMVSNRKVVPTLPTPCARTAPTRAHAARPSAGTWAVPQSTPR